MLCCSMCVVLVQALFFSPLQLLQMNTTKVFAKGAIAGGAAASIAVAAAAGTANAFTFGVVGAFGATADVIVTAPVRGLASICCGSSCGRA